MSSAALLVMDVGPRAEVRQPAWASELMREYY
jgi:hypothetical protein